MNSFLLEDEQKKKEKINNDDSTQKIISLYAEIPHLWISNHINVVFRLCINHRTFAIVDTSCQLSHILMIDCNVSGCHWTAG